MILLSFILGLSGFALLIYTLRINQTLSPKYTAAGFFLLLQFIITIATIIVSDSLDKKRERAHVIYYLQKTDLQLKINGSLIDSIRSAKIIHALKEITEIPAHHSSPGDSIVIELMSLKDTLRLVARPDSYNSGEFWMYYNKYGTAEIGRLRTDSNLFETP